MNPIYGLFDGQNLKTEDGKSYPVPANYASKSMLLEGDGLKLVIEADGEFVYKQAYPLPYKRLMVKVVNVTEDGATVVTPNNKFYKVLLANATYHHVSPGMSVTIRVPAGAEAAWAVVENTISDLNNNVKL